MSDIFYIQTLRKYISIVAYKSQISLWKSANLCLCTFSNVIFYILSYRNLNESKVIRVGDAASLAPYDSTKGLTLIIHGFKQNFTDKYPQELKNGKMKQKDVFKE